MDVMRKRHILPFFFVLLLVDSVFAQTASLADRIQAVMDRPEFTHSLFGIKVVSLDSGKTLYAFNAEKFFKPASTTKLLTMGTALEVLGADYCFHTYVYAAGQVKKNKLMGDLVLVASGDPNLSGRIQADGTLAFEDEDHSYDGDPDTKAVQGDPLLVIRELASKVAQKGITKIKGRVLVDAGLFSTGDRELGTGVVISPIAVNDNIVDVTVIPGKAEGEPATLKVSPQTAYVQFRNEIKTGAAKSRPAVDMGSDTIGIGGSHSVTVTGSIPADVPGILYAYRVPDPARFAETVLEEALRERGIRVEGKDRKPADFKKLSAFYKPENVIAEHVSPPVSEEVKVTLKVSQNLHASMWPAILGAIVKKDGKDSFRSGFDVEREFLTKAGLDLAGAAQGDGAGGAEAGLYTPDFMVSYLTYMSRQPSYPLFLKALPIMGRDGTLVKIQKDSPAAGHVFAKTGTYGDEDLLNRKLMLTAKGLAGYITTAQGEHLVFAAYVNRVSLSFDQDEITRVAGQALGEIAAAAYETQ